MGALDIGHPILGTYETSTTFHEVMIMGYNPIEYTVKYLDPQDGKYHYKDASEFVKMLAIYPPNL